MIEELRSELGKIAPEWDWFCEEKKVDSTDLISPRTLQVSGKNKTTGLQTIPIHVSAYPNARAPQLAHFIREVLMIETGKVQQASKTLLLEN